MLVRDQYTCGYCGSLEATEADHVVPKVRGGSDDMDNLIASCRSCNARKYSRSVGVFLAQADTPPVFPSHLHTITLNSGITGPCVGQSRQVGQR